MWELMFVNYVKVRNLAYPVYVVSIYLVIWIHLNPKLENGKVMIQQ